MRYICFSLIGFILLSLAPSCAMAAQLFYQLEGNANITFALDSEPSDVVLQPDGFIVENVDVTINGVKTTGDIGFVRELSAGGLIILGTQFNIAGPQLFSGPFDAPTLLTGNYELTGFLNSELVYSLSVSEVAAPAVPEPSTWFMMIMGFGLVAFALRGRRSGRLVSPLHLDVV